MLIAERNGIIGNGKGNEKPPLPYDYEVCYIESPNGNSGDMPYIDLSSALGGIKLSATIKWCPLSGTQGRWIFGGGLGSTPSYSRYGIYASGGTPFITPSGESAYFYYSGAGGTNIEVHDKQYVVLQTNYFSDSHIVLFCQWWATPNDRIQARIFSATFKDESGKIIMDLIPVRFTNEDGQIEGALYDKIGNSLYRKSGNLPFIIGPDTYKDYVQDGLIAMWDAIENAGPGVHDPTTTTWKDLSPNGIDMISNGEPNFGDNYMTSTKVENLWHTDETTVMDKTLSNGKFSYEVFAESIIGQSNQKLLIWGGSTPNSGFGGNVVCEDPSRIGLSFVIVDNGNLINYATRNLLAVFGAYSNGSDWYVRYQDGMQTDLIMSGGQITSLPIGYWQKRFAIGYRYGYSPDGPNTCGMKMYNFRLYNRNLSESEIAHNYEVDRRRFKLYTAKDYVQDGLIAMWDGIENVGWGTHSDATSSWIDLTGKGADWMLKGSWTPEVFEVGSDYVKILDRVSYINRGHCTPSWVESDIKTVELVFDSADFDTTGTTVSRVASFGIANGNLPTSIHLKGTELAMGGFNSWPQITYVQGGNSVSLLVGQTSAFVNGAHVTASKNAFSNYTYSPPVLGGYATTVAIGVKIKSIRLYNRVLDNSERATNCLIDKARFNLT